MSDRTKALLIGSAVSLLFVLLYFSPVPHESNFRYAFMALGALGFYTGYVIATLFEPNLGDWIRLITWPAIFAVNALFYGALAYAMLWARRGEDEPIT